MGDGESITTKLDMELSNLVIYDTAENVGKAKEQRSQPS
jgi:hypothetical protein